MLTRRRLIQSGLTTAAAVSFGPTFWRDAFAAPAGQARAGRPVRAAAAPGRQRHHAPAGLHLARDRPLHGGRPGHRLPLPDLPGRRGDVPDRRRRLDPRRQLRGRRRSGGASAIRFDAGGAITEAYRILDGTSTNCAGGPTPGARGSRARRSTRAGLGVRPDRREAPPSPRPAMGVFQHEAACVDPDHQQRLPQRGRRRRRALPLHARRRIRTSPPALLEIACPGGGDKVVWKAVPDPTGAADADPQPGRRTRSSSRAARASGSTAASSTWRPPPTRRSTSTTRTPTLEIALQGRRRAGHAAARRRQRPRHRVR